MSGNFIASFSVGFADGNSPGHVITLPVEIGAPEAGQTDVLFINSATTVTVTDFTQRNVLLSNQEVSWYDRVADGSEDDTITVITNGNHQTQVTLIRWGNLLAYQSGDSGFSQVNNVNGTTLPDADTGTLRTTDLLLMVGAALRNFDGDLSHTPTWDLAFTPLEEASNGSSGQSNAVVGFSAYKDGVGTAAEPTDVVSWLLNARDRYGAWIVYETESGGNDVTGTALAAIGFTASATGQKTVNATASASLGLSATATGQRSVSGTAAAALTFSATATGQKTVAGAATANLGALTASAVGKKTVVGAASAALVFSASASGDSTSTGQATAALVFSAAATGKRTVLGAGSAAIVFAASATAVDSELISATLPADGPVTGELPVYGPVSASLDF